MLFYSSIIYYMYNFLHCSKTVPDDRRLQQPWTSQSAIHIQTGKCMLKDKTPFKINESFYRTESIKYQNLNLYDK